MFWLRFELENWTAGVEFGRSIFTAHIGPLKLSWIVTGSQLHEDFKSVRQQETSSPKLEWGDYYIGSLKAPLADGAYYLIRLDATGHSYTASYSNGEAWEWSDDFPNSAAAQQACEDHLAAMEQ